MAAKKGRKTKPQMQPAAKKPSVIFQHPALFGILLMVVLLCVFYYQVVLLGKTMLPPDKLTASASEPFVKDALNRGIYPLWNPYIFSGMPFYASLTRAPRVNVIDHVIKSVLQALPITSFAFVLLNYVLLGSLLYLLLRRWGVQPAACVFAGLSIIFMPQYVAFTAFGHNTKFLALALIPLVFLLADRLINKRNLKYVALLSLVLGFQILRNHVQVVFYTLLLVGVYFVYRSVLFLKEKQGWKPIWQSGLLLTVSVVLGVMLSSVLYLSVYEYSHYSIRGGGEGALDYGYATNWSFSPVEMITFLVPSFMGFGGATYWGKMLWTDYPLYFGIVVFFFAGLALVLRRDRYTIFLSIVALLSLFVSFGRHLPVLYKPMFELLPLFNKFRIPSMIHIILDISVVMLAAFGLDAVRGLTKSKDTKLKSNIRAVQIFSAITLGILAVAFLLLLFGRDFYISMVAASGHRMTAELRSLAYNKALLDSFISLLLSAGAATLVVLYLKKTIRASLLVGAVVALAIIDLWFADFKIIDPKKPEDETRYFAKTEAVKYIQNDPDIFRIYAAPDPNNRTPNWYMYYKIQRVLGYHAAKVRIYQNFIEDTGLDRRTFLGIPPLFAKYWRVVSREGRTMVQPVAPMSIPPEQISSDRAILDMLNVKYVLSYFDLQDEQFQKVADGMPSVFLNTKVLPRAFFADTVKVMTGRGRISQFIKSGLFDPRKVAIIEEDPPFVVQRADSNRVRLTSYDIHEITLDAEVASPTVLVLSEVYYPAGWKAYVDNEETKIFKTDYILRSIFLQPGNHTIKFAFAPASFRIGLWMSIATLAVLIGVVAFTTVPKALHKQRKTAAEEPGM